MTRVPGLLCREGHICPLFPEAYKQKISSSICCFHPCWASSLLEMDQCSILTGTKMGTSRSHLSIYLQPSTNILEFLLCARHCFCLGINGGKKTDFWGEGKENWGRGWGWEKRKALPKNPVGSSEFWTILMYRLFKIQYLFECLPKKRYILIKQSVKGKTTLDGALKEKKIRPIQTIRGRFDLERGPGRLP